MNLKAKTYVQDQKAAAEQKLSARLAILKEKGMNEATAERDTQVRPIKAPTEAHVTQIVKTNAAGEFSYAMPRAG